MSKFKTLAFALLASFAIIGVYSCSDSSTSPSDSSTISAQISGAVNKSFSPNDIQFHFTSINGVTTAYILGATDSRDSLKIYINDFMNKPFTYDNANDRVTISYSTFVNGVQNQYNLVVDTLIVTTYSETELRGTFVGKTSGKPGDAGYLEIKNGTFYDQKSTSSK
jgi:hypothetical protein